MELIERIKRKVSSSLGDAMRIRRHLHRYPELSFQEYETSAFIQQELKRLEIPFRTIVETGVLGWITGQGGFSDDVIVLRADIDALPIDELNDVPYKSERKGVMHACGHDFHTSNLLGVAAVLKHIADYYAGTVVFLFQPAEERIPGGATAVLNAGILGEYTGRIKAILGLHVTPQLDVGKIGLCEGKFMASSDEFYIQIKGRGGHAAEPHRAIDPIYIGTQLLSALQHIISRKANPTIPSVLTFGRFIGDGAFNVIPDEVVMEGTFRTLDEIWREEAVADIERLIREIPKTFGAEVDLQIKRGYPFLYNDPVLTQQVRRYFTDVLGAEQVLPAGIWMAAEDFAYYSQRYPSLFFLVGVRNEGQRRQYGLHNARFDLDEAAFEPAMQAMLCATLGLLNQRLN